MAQSSYTPEQFERLPKNLRAYIRRLEDKVAHQASLLRNDPGSSLVFAEPHSDTPRPLGRQPLIRYLWGVRRGKEVYIDVERVGGALTLLSSEPLIVTAEAANSICVRPVEYRTVNGIDDANRALTAQNEPAPRAQGT